MKTLKAIIIGYLSFLALLASHSTKADSSVELKAYGDVYHSQNFDLPANAYRSNDSASGQTALGLAEISILAKHDEASMLLELDQGSSMDDASRGLGQAILGYRPKNSRWNFEAGKMNTHLGAESFKARDNYNYSRTLLNSYGLPIWHMGARASYEIVPEKLTGMVAVYNGANSYADNNRSQSIGGQLRYAYDGFSIAYNLLTGPERANSERDRRTLHEIVAVKGLGSGWELTTDLLHGEENGVDLGSGRTSARWWAAATSLKAPLSQSTYLSPRYEIFRDQHGQAMSRGPQTIQSATLTLGTALSKGLELRVEGRRDFSDHDTFGTGSNARRSQTTGLTGLIFSFP
ncbi:MAG TPA: outer membrane beta-barrel protein [Bdellovibrionota bacterium]|jgi:hypothetical protein